MITQVFIEDVLGLWLENDAHENPFDNGHSNNRPDFGLNWCLS